MSELLRLEVERDALNARIALIEEGERKAAYEASMQGQLITLNEARLSQGKRQISMLEFVSGMLMDEGTAR